MDITKLINDVYEEVKNLSEGDESSTARILAALYPNLKVSDKDLFKIETEVRKKAESDGIILDKSGDDGIYIGLPFNIPFVKRVKK